MGEADKAPNPTALQLRFVRASRRRSTKLQRLVLGSVTLAGLVATALAIIAWVERQHSERRASAAFVQVIADAKPLSALAHAVVETGEWFADDVPEIRSSLLSALQMSKERMRLVDSGERPIHRVALSANGITAAALDPLFVRDRANESLLVWDAQGKPIAFDPVGSPITALAACDAESLLVVGSRDGDLAPVGCRDTTASGRGTLRGAYRVIERYAQRKASPPPRRLRPWTSMGRRPRPRDSRGAPGGRRRHDVPQPPPPSMRSRSVRIASGSRSRGTAPPSSGRGVQSCVSHECFPKRGSPPRSLSTRAPVWSCAASRMDP